MYSTFSDISTYPSALLRVDIASDPVGIGKANVSPFASESKATGRKFLLPRVERSLLPIFALIGTCSKILIPANFLTKGDTNFL